MASSSTHLSAGTAASDVLPARTQPFNLKTYGFIVAMIAGIGGLAVGGAGVASYFHVGALSNVSQVNAIIMMAVGGGGTILFVTGVVGSVTTPTPK
ncbi:MAG: hypothetical protein JSS62_04035, partial [Verrucomicrobia bacterium]|nr:hypothetical protein [Verrucomicrobiota bacterium]